MYSLPFFRRINAYVLFLAIPLLGVVILSFTSARSMKQNQKVIADKDNILNQVSSQTGELKEENKEVSAELGQKESELKSKQDQYTKLSSDYATKLKQLDAANKEIKEQQAKIAANSAEISALRSKPAVFSFVVSSSNISNVEQKKEDIKQIVTSAYDVIEDVYSQPYLLKSVTIEFVDSLSIPGAYAEVQISNSSQGLSITIRIKDFDKNNFDDVNAIVHEVIHAFHGIAALSTPAYEEGITVAASDAVLKKMIAQGKIQAFSPLYIRMSVSDYLSTSTTLPSGSSFYTDSDAASYYQIAGIGWYEIYKADSNFFKTFNEKLYKKTRDGENVTASTLKSLIKESTSATVNGKSIDEWLETKAFKLN